MAGKPHIRLLALAEEAINEVFSDTSVSQETTLESLQDLAGVIEMKIAAIKSDLKRGARG